jgi:hypothetical protein
MQVINSLGQALTEMAKYAGGSVPSASDAQYTEWVTWLNQGQEDAAERGFWGRLLTKGTLVIEEDDEIATLPEDFHKRNGIYVLGVDDVDWAESRNTAGQKLYVNKNSDGEWVVNFIGFTPEEEATGTLWYFRHPGILEDEDDKFILDGKMCVFYALTEYFRQAGELGSLDDARAEYNNRFEEGLGLEMIPTPQELLSWKPYNQHANINANEHSYYSRNGRRRR